MGEENGYQFTENLQSEKTDRNLRVRNTGLALAIFLVVAHYTGHNGT